MITYFSTFITGFNSLIKESLRQKIRDADIINIFDGLIIYRTSSNLENIKEIRFFNNSFVLLKLFKRTENESLNQLIKKINNDQKLPRLILKNLPAKKCFFRVIISKENRMIPTSRSLISDLEKKFSKITTLKVSRSKPDIEFWLMLRREGVGFFGMRFTQNHDQEKYLAKGELRSELAHILCLISEPSSKEICLDPFCGSGAIPIERVLSYPCKYVIASDNNSKIIDNLRLKVKNINNARIKDKLLIKYWDAVYLKEIEDNEIDKIVTDPPWGLHFKNMDLDNFYLNMLKEFNRILRMGGIIVILISQKELFEKVLRKFSDELRIIREYSTLVSGQKATVYKINKPLSLASDKLTISGDVQILS
ncbi:MAG: RsmD family RNA methyltransferase [Patescibacteria group bacterium]